MKSYKIIFISIIALSSPSLFSMFSGFAEHPTIKSLILQQTATTNKKIKKAFKENGGMQAEEIISLETFEKLAENAKDEKKIFTLAIPELTEDTFQFYDAHNLADHFLTNKTIKTPTRAGIKELFIYNFLPLSTDKEFPFEYEKIITPDRIKDEFIPKYTTIDLTESVRRDIQHLQSLPNQTADILHEINLKRVDLIDLLNPTNAKNFGPHSQEIFTILKEILHDQQQQAEYNYAALNLIPMFIHGWGQPHNQPNYAEAIRLSNELISLNLQDKPAPSYIRVKNLAIDFGRYNLAELARTGHGQPNNKPNLKEAVRLYKLITSQNRLDSLYFKAQLALANLYNKAIQTRPQARKLYTEILEYANTPQANVEHDIIVEAQENLKQNILQSAPTSTAQAESEID